MDLIDALGVLSVEAKKYLDMSYIREAARRLK